MKRMISLLLALCLFCAPALAEDLWEEVDVFESRFGFTLFYPSDRLSVKEEEWEGWAAECFRPVDPAAGPALMVCRGSRFSGGAWRDGPRLETDEPDADPALPFDLRVYDGGDTVAEEWILAGADCDYAFILLYPKDDPDGFAEVFHDMLTLMDVPAQPAQTEFFRLDYEAEWDRENFVDVVVDEDAEPMMLTVLRDVSDFALEYVDWEDFEPVSAEALYEESFLAKGDGVRIYAYIPDMLPNLRVSCRGTDGEEQCWYISQSGRDGSLLLLPENGL